MRSVERTLLPLAREDHTKIFFSVKKRMICIWSLQTESRDYLTFSECEFNLEEDVNQFGAKGGIFE